MCATPRRPTIYDVAQEAGVSASTVSRAYARPGRVGAGTARRIFETAERLGYRNDRLTGRPSGLDRPTQTIGLVISDVTNPFYGEIIRGAYEAARAADYRLVLSHTGESGALERRAIERELPQVDGLVLASSRMSDSALRTAAKQRPVVLFNRAIPEVSCVVTDNQRGSQLAMEHLAGLGHEKITYLAGPDASWSDGTRWRALRDAGRSLAVDVRRLGPNEPTVMAGYRASSRVSTLGSTAVVAYNDQLAIGVIRGLKQRRIRIPQDVSVIGFDNIVFDEIVEPSLTTVAAPLYQMGHAGVRHCIAVVRGANPAAQILVLPVKLVVRSSTGQRKRNNTSPARSTTRASGSARKASMSSDAAST